MKILSFLSVVATTAAVQLNYLAPVSSGFIYRSDNNGPASLIQLGNHQYQQPAQLAPPLPLTQPLRPAFEAYDLAPAPLPYIVQEPIALAPAPLPYIAKEPIVVIDNENEDDSDEDEYLDNDDEGHEHGGAYEKGGGSDYSEEHHAAHGEKGSKGYYSKGYHAKGSKGQYGKKDNKGHYSEEEGDSASHHDEADAHGKHQQAGKHYKGDDHGLKKHHSKGEEITGYHKVYNKDEFKKDHDFYDVADNSGHFKKHGYQKEHHGAEKGGHNKGEKHDSGHSKGDAGKAGFYSKGNFDEDAVNHSAEEGNEEQHAHHAEYAKKGGSNKEKEYAYADEDDDDEEDDY